MKTCLIVDDSVMVRKVLRRIVEDLGFECSESENGLQAYETCNDYMPDAVLLDWNMPVMNGLEFLQKLRTMTNGDKPKVIFCTTENDATFIRRAINGGADEYIMKPFDGGIIRSKFGAVGLLE